MNNSKASSASGHIYGEKRLDSLMRRYLGEGPSLTHDETEVLLMALYMESCANGGIARRCTDSIDAKLRQQQVLVTKLVARSEERRVRP